VDITYLVGKTAPNNCFSLSLSLSKVQVPMISIGSKLRIFLKWK